MLNQRLQQKLLQKLSPQQILLMKLLQIPSVGLEQRIKQEIEENPALEVDNDESPEYERDDQQEAGSDQDDYAESSLDDVSNKDNEFDLNDYINEDDVPSYKLQTNNYSNDDEHKEIPFASGITFHELLTQQLQQQYLSEKKFQIGQYIIGNIDDSGYLERPIEAIVDDLAFSQNIATKKEEVEEVLKIIQEFEPAGVGARDLKECLLIQLHRKATETPSEGISLAIQILSRSFMDFTKKHFQKITKKLDISDEKLKMGIDEILKLNPKPGNSLSETTRTNHYIIPDFNITNNGEKLELTLNSWNSPDLRVSNAFASMMNEVGSQKQSKKQKEALSFIKQKVDSAKWFIDAIKQRQHTLYDTMYAIMEYQHDYLMTGDDTKLKPMILKDIAEKVNLDISTISRVANSKYVQTPFGTLLLKSFFSESMQKDDGEEVSTREIKTILKEIISEEDKRKPFTDEYLMERLREKGYPIARRTVAKYREQLQIPVARLRKEME
ncbi:MAG: RNA polymerase factor sigma-54 [Bacteroidales bacterium]|jgi:RNA polymerase sigma-54 factor|nr:RNA polymerase factor sigma-54 [Bacteroidota bacterium]MCF8348704.1 RNA polymerase factor sigma-54 [Bacteroidales bacterium]